MKKQILRAHLILYLDFLFLFIYLFFHRYWKGWWIWLYNYIWAPLHRDGEHEAKKTEKTTFEIYIYLIFLLNMHGLRN